MKFERVVLWSLLLSLGTFISVSHAQQAPASTEAVQVIGLAGLKQNTKGNLKVENGSLTFASSKSTCEVPAASLQDVVTGADSGSSGERWGRSRGWRLTAVERH